MNYASLYIVEPRMRKARKASVEGHPDMMIKDLSEWQKECTTKGDPEQTTAVVVVDGKYVTHIGPMDNHRRGALRRAGVNFPDLPSTQNMKKEQAYYEQVRDLIERKAECDTSDAQGIIEAWEIRNGGTIMEEINMDKAEEAGITPEDLANTILGVTTHDAMEQVPSDPNSKWKSVDRYADSYTEIHPDPFNVAEIEITTNHRTTLVGKLVLQVYHNAYFRFWDPIKASDDIAVLRRAGEAVYNSRVSRALEIRRVNLTAFIKKAEQDLEDMEKWTKHDLDKPFTT